MFKIFYKNYLPSPDILESCIGFFILIGTHLWDEIRLMFSKLLFKRFTVIMIETSPILVRCFEFKMKCEELNTNSGYGI